MAGTVNIAIQAQAHLEYGDMFYKTNWNREGFISHDAVQHITQEITTLWASLEKTGDFGGYWLVIACKNHGPNTVYLSFDDTVRHIMIPSREIAVVPWTGTTGFNRTIIRAQTNTGVSVLEYFGAEK